MSSFLQVLKSLQDQQNPNATDFNDFNNYKIQTLDYRQPDLNLHDTQGNQNDQYGYRFIEYVPFKRKVVDYQERVYKQRVPVTKVVTQQVERLFVQTVPKQKIITDYFAVQHLRYYKKQKVPEKTIQYVPVVRTIKKMQFVPVERKIVHYPKDIDPEMIDWNVKRETVHENSMQRLQRNNVQVNKVKPTRSLIKQLQFEDSGYENDMIVTANASILNSLSKAYTPEPSTQYGEGITRSYKYTQPVSPLQHIRLRRPSTFQEVDYRSTETIDSKYFMN